MGGLDLGSMSCWGRGDVWNRCLLSKKSEFLQSPYDPTTFMSSARHSIFAI